MAAPRVTFTKWLNVGLTKDLEIALAKYIRHNKDEVLSEGDAVRLLLKASLEDNVAQHNIILSNLLKEAVTLKTREQVLDWERRMEEEVL